MGFISVTRLRLRSVIYLPAFGLHTSRSLHQVRIADGFQQGAVLGDLKLAFWTMTMWDEQPSMRRYMVDGSHRIAMPYLMKWCDEASVVHWTGATALPSWDEADDRMRREGQPSKVLRPSPHHAGLTFEPSKRSFGSPINRPA